MDEQLIIEIVSVSLALVGVVYGFIQWKNLKAVLDVVVPFTSGYNEFLKDKQPDSEGGIAYTDSERLRIGDHAIEMYSKLTNVIDKYV